MKKFFSLVEIALAIAIIGIGMAGIMALFPIGFKASQDAIADNYASDAAETFMNYIRMSSDNNNWSIISNLQGKLMYSSGDDANNDASWTLLLNGIFSYKSDPNAGIYRICQGTQGAAFYDLSGVVRIWKTPLQAALYYDNTGLPTPPLPVVWDNYDYTIDNCANSAGIHMEISWPAGKPYDKREKRDFYMEVYKPK